jgi:hypothetical protein
MQWRCLHCVSRTLSHLQKGRGAVDDDTRPEHERRNGTCGGESRPIGIWVSSGRASSEWTRANQRSRDRKPATHAARRASQCSSRQTSRRTRKGGAGAARRTLARPPVHLGSKGPGIVRRWEQEQRETDDWAATCRAAHAQQEGTRDGEDEVVMRLAARRCRLGRRHLVLDESERRDALAPSEEAQVIERVAARGGDARQVALGGRGARCSAPAHARARS